MTFKTASFFYRYVDYYFKKKLEDKNIQLTYKHYSITSLPTKYYNE